MKVTRLKTLTVLLIGMVMAVAACGTSETNEEETNSNGGKHSGKLGRAETLVDSVRNELNWAKGKERYSDAKYAIDKLKSPTQRKNLTSLLNRNYCHSMDTIMQIILTEKDQCKSRHKELEAIHAERARFADINSSLHTRTEQAFDNHKKILAFIDNADAKQKNVTAWNTPYDEKTENDKKREAQKYLNTNPTCKQIIDGLNSIKSGAAFKNRRKKYCETILELYLQKESWTPQDERRLNGLLNSTFIDSYPNDPSVQEWTNMIEDFQKEKNN